MQIYEKDQDPGELMIDCCYVKNNLDAFRQRAEELGSTLCVIGRIKKQEKVFRAAVVPRYKKGHDIVFINTLSQNVPKNPKVHYLYTGQKSKSMHYPVDINHVVFKELHDKDKLLGISFNDVLRSRISIDELRFLVRMAFKYDVKIFVASFAHTPEELRAKRELQAFCSLIGMDTEMKTNALQVLKKRLRK